MKTLNTLLFFLASGFGSGRSPLVPGTTGTLAAIPVHIAAVWLLGPRSFAVAAVLFVPLAIVAANVACRRLQVKDPGLIVVDEWAGYFLTVALHPLHWQTIAAGFLVFRILDVVKPFPARRLERLPSGTGVVLDDVMVGVYGNLILWLILGPLRTFLA
jgi:phosphatidylglycerophosphatase A